MAGYLTITVSRIANAATCRSRVMRLTGRFEVWGGDEFASRKSSYLHATTLGLFGRRGLVGTTALGIFRWCGGRIGAAALAVLGFFGHVRATFAFATLAVFGHFSNGACAAVRVVRGKGIVVGYGFPEGAICQAYRQRGAESQ